MARKNFNFNNLWASNPDPDQFEPVPANIFEKGWEGGADKPLPQAKWENWWHRRADLALQQIERQGVLSYMLDVPYAQGAPVQASNGTRYLSLTDANEGNDPTLDVEQQFWLPYAVNGRATTELHGLVRFATVDEHIAGNAQNRAATPRGVREMINRFSIPLISLSGPSEVTQVVTAEYTISDFSSFSNYSVSVSVGTATISGDTITLTLVSGDNASGSITLTVIRDDKQVDFQIGIINVNIDRPVNVFPANGAIDVEPDVTLEASAFSVTGDTDTPTGSRWRIYDEFSGALIYDSGEIAYSNTHTVPSGELSPTAANYEWQVAYRGQTYGLSEYSARTSFTTVDEFISQPSITSPTNGAVDQPEQPVLASSAFSVTPAGAVNHTSSSWRVKNSAGTVVWQSLNNPSALLSIIIPAGVLNVSTTYTAEVRHEGASLVSAWSAESSFTTEAQFVPDTPGAPFGGGYFVRVMLDTDLTTEYALVVSPKAVGTNNQAVLNWSAANSYVTGLTIGGFSDWRLPDVDESGILYREFKPTTQANETSFGATNRVSPALDDYTVTNPSQTSQAAFRENGSESFVTFNQYWTSVPFGSNAESFSFQGGAWADNPQGFTRLVRAVRRVYL